MVKKILFFMCLTMGLASAEQGTDKDITYRKNIFQSIKAQTQNIGMILKSQAGQKADLEQLAAALHAQSKLISGAFQKDTSSLKAETKAKDNIWTDSADFNVEIDKFTAATALFYKKTQENEKISLKDFKSVVGSCKSCHQDYKD